MEKKKIKLTISGSSRKTKDSIELAKSQGKKTVVIEKKVGLVRNPHFLKMKHKENFKINQILIFNHKNHHFQNQINRMILKKGN